MPESRPDGSAPATEVKRFTSDTALLLLKRVMSESAWRRRRTPFFASTLFSHRTIDPRSAER